MKDVALRQAQGDIKVRTDVAPHHDNLLPLHANRYSLSAARSLLLALCYSLPADYSLPYNAAAVITSTPWYVPSLCILSEPTSARNSSVSVEPATAVRDVRDATV